MKLTNEEQRLLQDTDDSVNAEREATVRVLKNFLEIDRRRLYCALGKGSLKDFVMDRYKFSEDEAWRRIRAMKLLKEIPQIESKIESGTLTMTHIGLAQSLFQHEKKNHDRQFTQAQKLAVIEKIENTTTREAQKVAFSLASSPMFKTQDKVRPISESEIEVRFKAPGDLEHKLKKVKGLLAHTHPNISMAELIEKLCDLAIEELDPAGKKGRLQSQALAAPRTNGIGGNHVQSKKSRIRLTTKTRREVWMRDQSCCTNCGSVEALQIDHIHPAAQGGKNEMENLRLLCRSCNQRAAIEVFGVEKMEKHIRERIANPHCDYANWP